MFFYRNTPPVPLTQPKRILVVRFGGVGDVVQGMPLLVSLRTRFPQTEIAWLVDDKTAAMLHGHWALDRLIIVRQGWTKSWPEIRLLRKRLQAFAPDATIDMQGRLKSSFAAWISGARHRIGFGGTEGREGSRWLNNHRIVPTSEHVVERNLELLRPFGVHGGSIDFDLPECEMDRRNARNLLCRAGLAGDFTMINVGADWTSKRWREDRFAAVAKYLLDQWNLPSLIVWNGAEEHKSAETVVSQADGAAYLSPPMTLTELASVSRLATLCISSESGPLQIAAAAGTRCVGLYGPMAAQQFGPFGPSNRSVQVRFPGPGRSRLHRTSTEWMDAIPVSLVCETCDEILQEILQPDLLPMTKPGDSPQRTAA